jgi:CRP-like cAMP-binding protein
MISIISMRSPLPEPFDLLPPRALSPFLLRKGEMLYRTGEKSRGCFFLEEGEVRLLRWSRNGRETVIHRAKGGETFAEAALFSKAYHCDAVAAADAKGLLIRKSAVQSACQDNADFAAALMARLARQVQGLRRQVEILSLASAEERLMAALQQYEDAESGDLQNLPALKTLAGEIGLTHEAVYRAISSLVKQHRLVRLGRGRINLAERERPVPNVAAP